MGPKIPNPSCVEALKYYLYLVDKYRQMTVTHQPHDVSCLQKLITQQVSLRDDQELVRKTRGERPCWARGQCVNQAFLEIKTTMCVQTLGRGMPG